MQSEDLSVYKSLKHYIKLKRDFSIQCVKCEKIINPLPDLAGHQLQ